MEKVSAGEEYGSLKSVKLERISGRNLGFSFPEVTEALLQVSIDFNWKAVALLKH